MLEVHQTMVMMGLLYLNFHIMKQQKMIIHFIFKKKSSEEEEPQKICSHIPNPLRFLYRIYFFAIHVLSLTRAIF